MTPAFFPGSTFHSKLLCFLSCFPSSTAGWEMEVYSQSMIVYLCCFFSQAAASFRANLLAQVWGSPQVAVQISDPTWSSPQAEVKYLLHKKKRLEIKKQKIRFLGLIKYYISIFIKSMISYAGLCSSLRCLKLCIVRVGSLKCVPSHEYLTSLKSLQQNEVLIL